MNPALSSYLERQERGVRVKRAFERARKWGAAEDAERLHDAEKRNR